MGKQDDTVFLKRFSGIIAGLVIVSVVLIVIANFGDSPPEPGSNPSQVTLANERTRPVGAVRTELPAEVEAPPQVAVAIQAEPEVIDGEKIYAGMCSACHNTGAAGAPIPGSDTWAERAGKGLDALAYNAINGINAMPAKGGFANLTDAEVTAAVGHMLDQ